MLSPLCRSVSASIYEDTSQVGECFPFMRTLVIQDQDPHKEPHFNLITSLKFSSLSVTGFWATGTQAFSCELLGNVAQTITPAREKMTSAYWALGSAISWDHLHLPKWACPTPGSPLQTVWRGHEACWWAGLHPLCTPYLHREMGLQNWEWSPKEAPNPRT